MTGIGNKSVDFTGAHPEEFLRENPVIMGVGTLAALIVCVAVAVAVTRDRRAKNLRRERTRAALSQPVLVYAQPAPPLPVPAVLHGGESSADQGQRQADYLAAVTSREEDQH